MLITALLMATMAPTPAAAVETSRMAFAKCLRAHLKSSLEAKKSEAEFEMSLNTACEGERATFRTAVIALNRASGDSAAMAAENADMQVEDYHANFADKFKDYSSTNTLPAE